MIVGGAETQTSAQDELLFYFSFIIPSLLSVWYYKQGGAKVTWHPLFNINDVRKIRPVLICRRFKKEKWCEPSIPEASGRRRVL